MILNIWRLKLKLTNEQYHSQRTHLSSSTLKEVLKDPKSFVKFWLHGIRESKETAAMLEGTLVHTLLLEPEKVHAEYAFYEGMRRAGAAYEAFATNNAGKIIIGAPMAQRAHAAVKACAKLPVLLKLLSGGFTEHTVMCEFMGVPVKIRADYINIEQGYIVDLKTTSYPADLDIFKQTVDHFNYDLSAALYVAVAQVAYGKPFDFYLAPVSKTDLKADVYKVSAATLAKGMDKLVLAISMFKKLRNDNFILNVPKTDIEGDYEILEV